MKAQRSSAETATETAIETATETATETVDRILGGRVILAQPAKGYRVAIDPVLLAGAVAVQPGQSALELGCGTGAASLCLAARVPGCRIVAVEQNEEMAALAIRNVVANEAEDRIAVYRADFTDADFTGGHLTSRRRNGDTGFDHVFANPPFFAAGTASAPGPGKEAAYIEADTPLSAWLSAMLANLRPKGRITLIHRAERLDEIIAGLSGKAGEISIFPLWPKAGSAAKRVLVCGRAGMRGPARMLPGLILHGPDGRYTAEANAILRDGGRIEL
ncbi:MAG: methyltransferase [Alphaproteobacteria bacterium]|nr:methyltransferase [Alphaproteobacteria bacterium]